MTRATLTAMAVLAMVASGNARCGMPVGVAAPLTGPYAWNGEQTRVGSIKGLEDLNARGGVLGGPFAAVLVDDFCDPDQAVAAANRLVAEDVPFVVGHRCSGAAIPASDVYKKAGIILISPAATNPQLTYRGLRYTFRTCGRDDLQGSMVGHSAASEAGRRRPGGAAPPRRDQSSSTLPRMPLGM